MYQPEQFAECSDLADSLVDSVCGRRPPLLRSAKFKISARCNLKCIACSYWKGKEPEQVSTELACDTLDKMRRLGCQKVHFSGGEVFLRPDLFEILEHAVGLGMRVNITTNGTLIGKEEAEALAKSGIKSVAISIDGSTPKVHDDIRGVKGAWKKTMKGLDRILKARTKHKSKLKVRINTLVTRRNYLDIHHIVSLLQGRSICSLLLIPVDEKNSTNVGLNKARIQEYNDLIAPALADEALAAGLFDSIDEAYCFGRSSDALARASKGRYALGFFEDHLCYVPWLHTFISPNADVYLCCMTRNRIAPIGNLNDTPFDELYLGEQLQSIRQRMIHERFPICHKCDNFLNENRVIDAAVGDRIAKEVYKGNTPPPLPKEKSEELLTVATPLCCKT